MTRTIVSLPAFLNGPTYFCGLLNGPANFGELLNSPAYSGGLLNGPAYFGELLNGPAYFGGLLNGLAYFGGLLNGPTYFWWAARCKFKGRMCDSGSGEGTLKLYLGIHLKSIKKIPRSNMKHFTRPVTNRKLSRLFIPAPPDYGYMTQQ